MPTYEYRCKACGHELEVVQAFTDDALSTCPSCGTEELRKVFGSVGISFKGSGFYKNDSRSSSSVGSSSSSSSSGEGSGDKSSSSSESSSSSSDKATTSSDKGSSSTTGSTSSDTASTKPAKSA